MTEPSRYPGLPRAAWKLLILLPFLVACGGPELPLSHTVKLEKDYALARSSEIESFADYLQMEDDLFRELDERVISANPTGADQALQRYSRGSLSDPSARQPNWNRSFELAPENPRGAVLLLHGMTDSPYSLRAVGERLQRERFHVLGLRLPGHGTAPSGMLDVTWQDMSAATTLAMVHLAQKVGSLPIHIIGYSTGGALALDYVLQVEEQGEGPMPRSLVLVSPAIGISPAAALAQWKRGLSMLPGLGGMAWLQVETEFDPYKYNSFSTNAAEQVHLLTHSVTQRVERRRSSGRQLPPILIFKSTVDATVSTDAVVDRLLSKLSAGRHELVIFDINRFAVNTALLVEDPAPFTRRLIENHQLPFGVTLVTNSTPESRSITVYRKTAFESGASSEEAMNSEWPTGVFSLSHVALPFPPDDPLYGRHPPENRGELFLGTQALQGERGVLRVPDNFLLRLRHNPFYEYLEERTLNWLSR